MKNTRRSTAATDILGLAMLDYLNVNYTEDILTETNISEEDVLPLPYLFRTFEEMPKIEQKALKLCKERILDVGCGAGGHSLYLQTQGKEVIAIDTSPGAVEVARRRGLKNVRQIDLLEVNEKFDTILLLMNGTGIFQKIDFVPNYLNHLKSILSEDGQILLDSSDLTYMYQDEPELLQDLETYYGELDYFLSYKGLKNPPIKWLYLDFKTLKGLSMAQGLTCELLMEGENHDYLARLIIGPPYSSNIGSPLI